MTAAQQKALAEMESDLLVHEPAWGNEWGKTARLETRVLADQVREHPDRWTKYDLHADPYGANDGSLIVYPVDGDGFPLVTCSAPLVGGLGTIIAKDGRTTPSEM